MRLEYTSRVLETAHPFGISRSRSSRFENVFLKLRDSSHTGYGEAAPSSYYGEKAESVQDFLEKTDFGKIDDPFRIRAIEETLNSVSDGDSSAKAALDMALYDLIGKKLGQPLWRLFGLSPEQSGRTSFTLGLDEPEVIEQKVREAEGFPVLKIKLGVDYEEEILKTIRKHSEAEIRVDANCAWEPEEAVEKIARYKKYNIQFVEQPVDAGNPEGLKYVTENTDLPVYADESVRYSGDITFLADKVDGINIKLMKCGGITEALKMIHTAEAHGLGIMIGCMVSSSLAITAAAHLSPLADYLDLDGNLLLADDPVRGVKNDTGELILPRKPGLGVGFREENFLD